MGIFLNKTSKKSFARPLGSHQTNLVMVAKIEPEMNTFSLILTRCWLTAVNRNKLWDATETENESFLSPIWTVNMLTLLKHANM